MKESNAHKPGGHARLLPVSGLIAASCLLTVLGCHDKAPAPWPWWTDKDRAAANSELAAWRDSISTRVFVEGAAEPLVDSAGIIARDSTSPSGDSLIKVARLLGFGLRADDAARRDSLLFGVTVDSIYVDTMLKDTFCYVIAIDSSLSGFGVMQYDRYYVINYHRIVTVDTTVAPPETTITWKLDSLAPPPRLVEGQTFESQKEAPWNVKRYIYLRKAAASYNLRRMSGFSVFMPNTTTAPNIRQVILTYVGATDTYRLNAQSNRHGIYNLKDIDTLYTVTKGSELTVSIQTDAPTLAGDRFYYIARFGGQRTLLGSDTLGLTATVTFPSAGIQNLVLEVVPQSNLLYPASDYSAAIWSLPIRVRE